MGNFNLHHSRKDISGTHKDEKRKNSFGPEGFASKCAF